MNDFKNKKILITGVNGFVGRNFLHVLMDKDLHVQYFSRKKLTPYPISLVNYLYTYLLF
jgi:nucleoside-diphosphate-sugar epimerase